MDKEKVKKCISNFYDKESLVELTMAFLENDFATNRGILYFNMRCIFSHMQGDTLEIIERFKNTPNKKNYLKLIQSFQSDERAIGTLIDEIEKELYSEELKNERNSNNFNDCI